jgi:hypothetical protein
MALIIAYFLLCSFFDYVYIASSSANFDRSYKTVLRYFLLLFPQLHHFELPQRCISVQIVLHKRACQLTICPTLKPVPTSWTRITNRVDFVPISRIESGRVKASTHSNIFFCGVVRIFFPTKHRNHLVPKQVDPRPA